MSHYKHLSLEERQTFFTLRHQGISMADIAKELGRHRSTLYRELDRLIEKARQYDPFKAHQQALSKRFQQRKGKIEKYSTLRQYVIAHLKIGWTPEQISGRLKRKKSKYYLCHETIYQFIYRKKHKKLFQYLPKKKPKRRRQFSRKPQVCRFGNKRIITERSKSIDKRFHYGHWEGDRIEFKGEKSAAVTTLVERKTKVVVLIKNTTKKTNLVMGDICKKLRGNSNKVCKTITFDQGSEFANFALLEQTLKCSVFYCHKHSPWEKGTNENMNGRIRRYLPSHLNIDEITQEELDQLSKTLNNTPRKCLGFKTPKELFLKHYKDDCRSWF